jgi:hypothetical protein
MVHLPRNLQQRLTWDTKTIAFSTDITPSLYYLLGHKPISQNRLFGRPLFTLSKEEQALDSQGTFLIANSYEPVWGILSNNGRSLFIADAMNQTDYLYEFDDWHKPTRRAITERIRVQNHQLIADAIAEINRFYAYKAAGESPAKPEP